MRAVDGLQVVEMVYQRFCAHDCTDGEGDVNEETASQPIQYTHQAEVETRTHTHTPHPVSCKH
jgi:hypothetical protein